MQLQKEQLENIINRAKYYDTEEEVWIPSFLEILETYGKENLEIGKIVSFDSFDKKEKIPIFMLNSLLGFLSYVHKREQWERFVSQKVLGEIYYDYLEQLFNISKGILPEILLLSKKDIIYLDYDDVIQISISYPVWARKVTEVTVQWCDFMGEMLNRIQKDMDYHSITKLYSMGSDSHNYGRRVFCFELDGTRKLLYKPHGFDMDEGWIQLCKWVSQKMQRKIPYIKIKNYGTYGYAEYISYCSPTEKEIPKFFYHAGILLCLMYWTKGTDIHYENIIAHGDWPYIVDLETVSGEKEGFTVLDTSMLQNKKYRSGKEIDDFGALTNSSQECFSLPRYKEQIVTAKGYVEEIQSGFQEIYSILMKTSQREINFFKQCSPRCVLHPTSYYSTLLARLLLKDTLTDGRLYYQEAKRSLERVQKSESIVESECKAILRGDIPIFYHKKGTKDLYDTERVIEKKFFKCFPGEALCREFTKEELQKQLKLIQEGSCKSIDN